MPKLKKEKWGKPKLIILTSGKPEERMLLTCKTDVVAGGDVYGSWERCKNAPPLEACQVPCEAPGGT